MIHQFRRCSQLCIFFLIALFVFLQPGAMNAQDEPKKSSGGKKPIPSPLPVLKIFDDLHPPFPDLVIDGDWTGDEWKSIGPVGMPLFNHDVISGQVNVIAVDPTNADVLFAGASEGGVWRTLDGGGTWKAVSDYQLVRPTSTGQHRGTLSIGALAIDPANPQTIYAGTGNPNPATGIVGPALGVFRSTNRGDAWQPKGVALQQSGCSNAVMSGAVVKRIVVVRGRPSVVFAATNRGLFRYTEDGSDCWTKIMSGLPALDATDLAMDPYRGLLYVALRGDGIYKSTDATGLTWIKASYGLPANGFRRVALTFGSRTLGFSDPKQLLYAGFEMNDGRYGLYKTNDGGNLWTQLPSPPSEGQLNFNNALAVGLYHSDEVYIGQIALWRAIDGGAKGGRNNFKVSPPVTDSSWFNLSCCLSHPHVNPVRTGMDLHADIHDIVFAPSGSFIPTPSRVQIVYVANDGGVAKGTIDFEGVVRWEPLTLGLVVSQIGTIGLSPRSPSTTAAGIWHNGNSWTITGTTDKLFGGGDGFQASIDAGSIDGPGFSHFVVYFNCNAGFGGQICRANIGGNGVTFSSQRIWDDGNALKFWSDPYRPGHLLRLQKDDGFVYRTKIAHTGTPEQLKTAWEVLDANIGKTGKTTTLAVRSALLEANPVYYIGTDSGQIWRGSPEAGWTKLCDCGLQVNAIATDDFTNERIYVAFNATNGPGRIRELSRGPLGQWLVRNIDDQFFPELKVNNVASIAMAPLPDIHGVTVYVGTEQGVYKGRKTIPVIDPGVAAAIPLPVFGDWTWQRSSGVPNVLVLDLEAHRGRSFNDRAGILRAGTYGRGIFELKQTKGGSGSRYPAGLEVVILHLGEDGADPYLHPAIGVTWAKAKAVRQAPFRVLPDVGRVNLETPIEIKTEEGELKFTGWVLDGRYLSKENNITIDIKDKMTVVGYYEQKNKKEAFKNDVMRRQVIIEE